MSFDYSKLPREYPRRFLPPDLDFANWSQLEQVFDALQKRSIESKGDIERWLEDESEFSAAMFEAWEIRYIGMTCQTDDPEREKAYLQFVENIDPKAKVRSHYLNRKFLETPARRELPELYFVLARKKENNITIFREGNVELEKQEAKLAQQYEKIAGARTVFYDGQEKTLQQIARYLEEVNRDIRQETWHLAEERRLKDREAVDKTYSELVALRQRIAENAGFDNYRDYAFRRRERFDYTPQDCFQFHKAVEQYVVPLIRTIQQERGLRLGVDVLRPWDLAVDPTGRTPLRPFKTPLEFTRGCAQIYDQIDLQFGRDFRRMEELGLLDLESRRGKAPGGYCFELSEIRLPFIFLNSVGRDGDMRVLLHESGHAFHTFATRNARMNFQYLGENMPTEFAEVASMTMELLGGEHIEGTFYNHEDAVRSKREHLEHVALGLAWIATIDAFQHWVYTNPNHSLEEREEFWLKLHERFGGIENWEGFENMLRSFWQRQLHLFTLPFYYIEYGIAQLGALGIWTKYRKDPDTAVGAYKRALALGGSKPLPELFKAADLPFDFGPEIVRSFAQELRAQLQES